MIHTKSQYSIVLITWLRFCKWPILLILAARLLCCIMKCDTESQLNDKTSNFDTQIFDCFMCPWDGMLLPRIGLWEPILCSP